MITRRSLFAGLASLWAVPVAVAAASTDASWRRILELVRPLPEEFVFAPTRVYLIPREPEYYVGLDFGKVTGITIQREINGRIVRCGYGGPSAEAELRRMGYLKTHQGPINVGDKCRLDDGSVVTIGKIEVDLRFEGC